MNNYNKLKYKILIQKKNKKILNLKIDVKY